MRWLLVSVVLAGATAAPAFPSPQESTAASREFTEHVDDYVALHRRLARTLPGLDEGFDPWGMLLARRYLANELRRARGATEAGSIFTPAVRPLFRSAIATAIEGPGGDELRALAARTERDAGGRRAAVDEPLPAAAAAVPPARLLELLPPLPPEVAYRIAGRDLVLWNVYAEIAVDVLTDAFQ